MSKFKINGEQCLEVIKLYQQGLTMQKIADIFSVGSTTIRGILKKNNIKSRKFFDYIEKFSPEKEAEMITLYNQGLTIKKLSEMFGLGKTTIANKLRKNKVKTRELSDYRKIFSPEEELEVIELYKKDYSMSSLAKNFNCSVSVINNILSKHNIQKKNTAFYSKKLSIEQEKEIIELYAKGQTVKKIAKNYKSSIKTISKALKRNNIQTRSFFIKKYFLNKKIRLLSFI